ncbi:MAG: beta-ketoacyl-ACP synthase III [Eubacteriales bacterium]
MQGIKIMGIGSCLPPKVVTNDDMSQIVDTSDEWITKRTGIKTRHHCVEERHVDLAFDAAQKALEQSGVDKDKIGVCIVATVTPDQMIPSTACMVQAMLGLSEETASFDINAACSGFIYGLRAAQGLLSEEKPYGLVIGCEVLSRYTDFTDRGTCVLFGDGAGAVVIAKCEGNAAAVLGSRGDDFLLRTTPAHGEKPSMIQMEGTTVFKFAVDIVPKCLRQVLDEAGKTMEDMDHIVLHQANERILDHVVKKMKLPAEKVMKIIDKFGNMSAACVPIALDELWKSGAMKVGQKLITVGFGGGLTWAGIILEVGETL